MLLRCGDHRLSLARPLVMGIVNLTADSFSGDGLASDTAKAIEHAHRQIGEGAEMLDIGAESSRPGAVPTSVEVELGRLLPVLDALTGCGVPISVDTYKPEVMRAALLHGASMINDIYALRMPGALAAVADSDCAICLMHMRGEPLTMQENPVYTDVVTEVRDFLQSRVNLARTAGIASDRLVLDPGFGFGKALHHNLEMLRRFAEFTVIGLPVLAGISRKSMLGAITSRTVEDRLAASVAAALLAAQRGARLLRVHDVAQTRDALAIWLALENQ
ncbi:MAG: dihydropteroate synthase [Candidatus Accumulibacter phosphatis]|uniref:dihydropteroate synthase n=3 Tax=Candidatus Accumulibacter TaxID=327159 RepID=A0A7D5NBN7_9PROT|nr:MULTISPECIES: dihydropteroate synthase [Candidatus Accumulibacter]MBL8401012.1 dihydropteroate synthase [Accumulibacter sp.]MBN8517001.1 dihydropteroate synthase [Accumulibacter sp.]MBO3709775.1 dihydropteroate synthase [Accumulibacter sp.]MCC2867763.1 dihydropteroate synthase [Candidatus Accumulibacter phosphatis]MCM8578182.1 dihydropteroate synthase [Accumulibacter sp.]